MRLLVGPETDGKDAFRRQPVARAPTNGENSGIVGTGKIRRRAFLVIRYGICETRPLRLTWRKSAATAGDGNLVQRVVNPHRAC